MNKMDKLPTENTNPTKNDAWKSNNFGVYSYHNSIILYDETGIYNLTWAWTPSSKTLLEEGNELNYNELNKPLQEKILQIHETRIGKSYTKDQITPMLFPEMLNSSFTSLLNESTELNDSEKEKINKAASIMKSSHKNQFRDEWLPYYVHPLKVAFDILKDGGSYEEIICWLLHDVIEDDETIDKNMLYESFWEDVVNSILALSKKVWNWEKLKQDAYINNLWQNKNAITVKWYDRINNLSSTYFSTPEKREKYIQETELVYIPFFEQHDPEVAKKLTEIIKYLKFNEKPTDKELQLINQVHETYVLTEKIQENE